LSEGGNQRSDEIRLKDYGRRVKGVEDLCPFEKEDWWYRINQKPGLEEVSLLPERRWDTWTMEDEGGMDTNGLEHGVGQREVQGVSVTGSGA